VTNVTYHQDNKGLFYVDPMLNVTKGLFLVFVARWRHAELVADSVPGVGGWLLPQTQGQPPSAVQPSEARRQCQRADTGQLGHGLALLSSSIPAKDRVREETSENRPPVHGRVGMVRRPKGASWIAAFFLVCLGLARGKLIRETNEMRLEISSRVAGEVAAFSRACAPVQVPPYRL
jgi:hypothetical protein